jgi:hypothetical protein
VLLYSGPPDQAPSCPAPITNNVFSAHGDVVQDPAQCSTCTVGDPYNFWCFAEIAAYPDATCSSGMADSVFFGLDYCNNVGPTDDASAIGVEAPQGSFLCDPSPQHTTLPPVRWGTAAIGCTAPTPQANGCSADKTCLPVPQGPFGTQTCIYSSGDVSCPSGPYTTKTTYYSGALDNRSCTPCGYVPSSLGCSATAILYSDNKCAQELMTVTDFTGTCMSLPGSFSSAKLVSAAVSGTATCTATGGDPQGSIAPSGPMTVCCTP